MIILTICKSEANSFSSLSVNPLTLLVVSSTILWLPERLLGIAINLSVLIMGSRPPCCHVCHWRWYLNTPVRLSSVKGTIIRGRCLSPSKLIPGTTLPPISLRLTAPCQLNRFLLAKRTFLPWGIANFLNSCSWGKITKPCFLNSLIIPAKSFWALAQIALIV